MAWTVLDFGRNKGRTLPEVMFKDPDWFFWLYENGYNGDDPRLREEFDEVYIKARNIKIPGNANGDKEVRYYIDPEPPENTLEGSFVTLGICTKGQRNYFEDEGDSYIVKDVIDFKVPREMMKKDEYGYELFLKKMKNILFGALLKPVALTRRRCEEFFENPDNFDIADEDVVAFLTPYDPE